MELEKVYEQLCVHDSRYPDFISIHRNYEPNEIPAPRQNCFCDNCFYGRDTLALEILRLRSLDPEA